MDFRTCPSCQASVLEDDVEDCPFCGASMSGKPKPKPAPKKEAAESSKKPKSAAAPKSATKKPAKKKAAAPAKAEKDDGDDDPFDVDTSAVRRAIKLSPKPTKSRQYEVVCPMCETRGFMPKEQAGKDVQCSNSECIVPVFKSKRPKIEKVEEEPKSKAGLIAAVSVAALVVVGVVVWFVVLNPEEEDPMSQFETPGPITPSCADCEEPVICADCEEPKPDILTLVEVREESLELVVDRATDRRDNRSPDTGTQIATEALAISGEIKKAQAQLKRLQASARNAPHLQVEPLAEIAWAQLAAGDEASALKTAMNAVDKSKTLPPSSRQSVNASTLLASVLIALGKTEDAEKLIRSQKATGWRGTASVLWRTALDSRTFDMDVEHERPYYCAIPEPMRAGVVATLVARNRPDDAFTFAQSIEDLPTRDASLATWAGRVTEVNGESAVELISGKLQPASLTPIAQTRVWSAVASHLATANASGGADSAYQKAAEAAGQIAEPKSAPRYSMKRIYDSRRMKNLGLGETATSRSASSAFTDLAIVGIQLGKTTEAAGHLKKSMQHARGMTPSPARTQDWFDECQNREGSIKAQLNRILNLKNDSSDIRNSFISYRKQCEKLDDEADARFAFQVDLLRAVARHGLLDEVWNIAKTAENADNVDEREPFMTTSLPGFVAIKARFQKLESLRSELEGAINAYDNYQYDRIDGRMSLVEDRLRAKNFAAAADELKQLYQMSKDRKFRGAIDADRLDVVALARIAELQQTESLENTILFITKSFDKLLKEDAMLFLGGYVIQAEKAPELWKLLKTPLARDLGSLEYTTMYRGILTAISATPQELEESSIENQQAQAQ